MPRTMSRASGIVLRRALLGSVFLMRGAVPARSQTSHLSSRIRARMRQFVAEGLISGSVTLVGRADEIVSLEAVGLRSIEDGLPMRPDTLFRIASMTKSITALGVMMLAEEGKLALDDPVEKHLPEFRGQMLVAERSGDTLILKPPPRVITLRELLTHTSGLPSTAPAGLHEVPDSWLQSPENPRLWLKVAAVS